MGKRFELTPGAGLGKAPQVWEHLPCWTQAKQWFLRFDTNRDGSLNRHELLKMPRTPACVQAAFVISNQAAIM
eukprot:12895328-Prorocentrum_lima.AAC.1